MTTKANAKVLIICLIISVVLAGAFTFFDRYGDEQKATKTENDANKDSQIGVHFVDVGQGDCIIIQTENNNILIDTGEYSQKHTITDYIKKLKINRFDYVIATHPHSDHIGSLQSILNEYEIGTLIMPKVKDELVPTSNWYKRALEAISNKNLKIHKAKIGETFDIDGAVLKILAPVGTYDNLNNYSIVCKLTYGNRSFLFSGDAEKTAELDIVNKFSGELSADVLKVGHHGSKTSTSKEYISEISPEFAVISSGAGNDYGHPHLTTLKRLEGTEILRTDLLGTIVFYTDGENLEYCTEKQKNDNN